MASLCVNQSSNIHASYTNPCGQLNKHIRNGYELDIIHDELAVL